MSLSEQEKERIDSEIVRVREILGTTINEIAAEFTALDVAKGRVKIEDMSLDTLRLVHSVVHRTVIQLVVQGKLILPPSQELVRE